MKSYLIHHHHRVFHWDGNTPYGIGHPFRWIFERHDNHIRVRDLKTAKWISIDPKLITEQGYEVPFENSIILTPTRERFQIPQNYSSHVDVSTLPQLPLSDVLPIHLAELEHHFIKSLKQAGIALMALLLISFAVPLFKPKQEELIPEEFTKIVMKKTVKLAVAPAKPQVQDMKTAAAGSKEKSPAMQKRNAQVAQAFRSKALQSAVKGLLKGGMTKLLAQNANLLASPLEAQAASQFKNAERGLASAAIVGLNTGKNVDVASLGGSGQGKGGVGYGKGAGAKVSGQGNGFVSMDLGSSTVEEGLTKEEVGRVIHAHMNEIRYCYESSMVRQSDLEGKLMLDFTINGSGIVSIAGVKESSLGDARLDDCIVRRLNKWKFPQPKGGVDVAVTYPFIFKTLGK